MCFLVFNVAVDYIVFPQILLLAQWKLFFPGLGLFFLSIFTFTITSKEVLISSMLQGFHSDCLPLVFFLRCSPICYATMKRLRMEEGRTWNEEHKVTKIGYFIGCQSISVRLESFLFREHFSQLLLFVLLMTSWNNNFDFWSFLISDLSSEVWFYKKILIVKI